MISSTSPGSAAASVGRRRVAGEQRRRHHVDPDVGRLGRQDRRRQQLERVGVVELAHGVGVRLGEAPGDLAASGPWASAGGPPRRRSGSAAMRHGAYGAPHRPIFDADATPEITRGPTTTSTAPRSDRLLAAAAAADGRLPALGPPAPRAGARWPARVRRARRSAVRRPRRLRPAGGGQRRPHRRARRRPRPPGTTPSLAADLLARGGRRRRRRRGRPRAVVGVRRRRRRRRARPAGPA